MATPTHQEGGYELGSYVAWIAGALAVGAGAGVLLGANPIATAAAGLGALSLGNGLTLLPRAFARSGSEPTPIASIGAGSGAVEAAGTARPDRETVTAPYTGEECLAYAVGVESYEHSGETWSWETEYSQSNSRPFLLEDGTGTAWVDPTDAEFHMPVMDRVERDAGEEPPERFHEALTDGGGATPGGREADAVVPVGDDGGTSVVDDHHRRRYPEYRLDPGEEVSVDGEARPAPDPGATDGDPELAIGDGDSIPAYTISTDEDRDVGNELLQRAVGPILIGTLLLGGGLGWVFVA
jgi:hypothetical protein